MKTSFITFYYDYDGTNYYELCAQRLKTQIESFGGNLIIKTPKLEESYNINCLKKPQIILDEILNYKKPLIWIDADSNVNKLPEEFDMFEDYDVGFVLRTHDYKTPHAAIIYFNYNENSLNFLNIWNNKCKNKINEVIHKKYDGGDHCMLIETFNELKINYGFASPKYASTNIKDSMINIGISPGGFGVESRKV